MVFDRMYWKKVTAEHHPCMHVTALVTGVFCRSASVDRMLRTEYSVLHLKLRRTPYLILFAIGIPIWLPCDPLTWVCHEIIG